MAESWDPRPVRLTVTLEHEEYREEVAGALKEWEEGKITLTELLVPDEGLTIEADFEVHHRLRDFRLMMMFNTWASNLHEAISELHVSGLSGTNGSFSLSIGSSDSSVREPQLFALKGGPRDRDSRRAISEERLRAHQRIIERDGNACTICGQSMHAESMTAFSVVPQLRGKGSKKLAKKVGIDTKIGVCYKCGLEHIKTPYDVYTRTSRLHREPPYARLYEQVQHLRKQHPEYELFVQMYEGFFLAGIEGKAEEWIESRKKKQADQHRLIGITRTQRFTELAERDGTLACVWCGSENASGNPTLEHVIPKSVNGPNQLDNYLIACGPCNTARAAHPIHVWIPMCLERGWTPNIPVAQRRLTALSERPDDIGERARDDLARLRERFPSVETV